MATALLSTVDAIGSVADRVQRDDLSPWLEADFLLAMSGLAWFAIVLVYVARHPRRIRSVELYPIHKDMETLGGGLDRDCREADDLWVAFESGDYYYSGIDDELRPKISRMILLHPDSPHVEYLSRFSGIDAETIRQQIQLTTKRARLIAEDNKRDIAVRWSRDPILNCVIGRHRRGKTAFARIQVFCPQEFTKNWPNIRITKRQDGETLSRIACVYEKMWDSSEEPGSLVEAQSLGHLMAMDDNGYMTFGDEIVQRGTTLEVKKVKQSGSDSESRPPQRGES